MTLKELLKIAIDQLSPLTTVSTPDFRLEQAEYNKEEKTWDIVVSYLVENTNKRTALTAIISEFQYYRIYKRIKINENNEIIGLYIFNNKE
jgi:hypothetical protein